MRFVNYRQLVEDVRSWSQQLPPDIVAVVGIPRSGLLPALHLALHRNCHLAELGQVLRGDRPWEQPLRRGDVRANGSRLLIVDDSMARGATILELRRKLAGVDVGATCEFGAVYCRKPVRHLVEHAFRNVPHPRCFEWNVFHCGHLPRTCVDLDGVLCPDPPMREPDGGPELDRWLQHLENVVPRVVPSFPVHAVVTSRLEKYRRQTTAWLERHGIRFGELVMSPHTSAAARRAARDHAQRKAAYYMSHRRARLFIESSHKQACEIARLSRRPVLCTDTMEMMH